MVHLLIGGKESGIDSLESRILAMYFDVRRDGGGHGRPGRRAGQIAVWKSDGVARSAEWILPIP